jgi:two-component system OmpR family sensor kinase
MSQEEVEIVFDRYTRFDKTQGGFGIGYNIIYQIVQEYKLSIKIDSNKGVGTCVTISW